MNRAQANSQAASDYARKKKEQLERANKLRMERNSIQQSQSNQQNNISRPNSNTTNSRPSSGQELAVMYESLENPTQYDRVKITRQNYEYVDQTKLEQQAKAKHERDLEIYHQMKESSRDTHASNPRVTASSIISDPYSLAHIRNCNAPSANGNSFFNSPIDSAGRLVDVSDRPLLCMSSNMRNEIVVGSADHALYSIDISNPSRSPITMYSKSAGHTDWITGVSHLADGRVISSSMDGKLCLWETNRRNCVDLFGHQGSITKVVSDMVHNVAVSIGYDGKILIWSIPVQTMSISQQRRSASRSRSSTSSSSSSASSSAYNPAATLIGHKSPILECSYHNNGGTRGVLASGDRDGKIIIWEIETGAMIARYKAHNGPITSFDTTFNSDDNNYYFVSGGSDGMVKLWDSRVNSSVLKLALHANNDTNSKKTSNSRNYSAAVSCISCFSNGNYIASGGSDNALVLSDIRGGETNSIVNKYQHSKNGIYSICIIGDNCIVSGDGVGTVLVYDINGRNNDYNDRYNDYNGLKYGLNACSNGGIRGITCLDGKLVSIGEDGKVLIYSY